MTTTFTQDWFSHNIPNFQMIKQLLPDLKDALEIGCFEGRASCWMLDNLLPDDGSLVCVDTFKGSEEHANLNLNDLFDRWQENVNWVRKHTQSCIPYKGTSYEVLPEMICEGFRFDFIYIDGSHIAKDVMTDACMAWGMLKKGGIMLFDDYLWQDMPGLLHRPKLGVDYFTTLFSEENELCMIGYQYALRKL